jgi:hypothetical protein
MMTPRSLERRGAFMLASLLAMWFIAINAAAAEVASDNELYAAYCIGVLTNATRAAKALG